VHNKFDKSYSQLIARGANIDNIIGILFNTSLLVPCHNFKSYIRHQHQGLSWWQLTAITQEALMTSAKRKFDWLQPRELGERNLPTTQKLW
jgi:hypothetical protein